MNYDCESVKEARELVRVAQELDQRLGSGKDATWESFEFSERWKHIRQGMTLEQKLGFRAMWQTLYEDIVEPHEGEIKNPG